MSASSTSPSTSSSQEEHPEASKNIGDPDATIRKTITHSNSYGPSVYANSTISTLDRSQYQSLPLSGTRRVTVQFGSMKIVVPWKEATHSTVGQLADAALMRYKRVKGMTIEDIHVLRLECASDGGILDMDDVLEDVFDLNYDQILAITDEANGSSNYAQIQKHNQHHYAQPLPYSRKDGQETFHAPVASAFGSVTVNNSATPYNVGYARSSSHSHDNHKNQRESVVEVNSFDDPPPGLRVNMTPNNRSSFNRVDDDKTPVLKPSLRTDASREETQKQARVTLSPEVEKKLAEQEGHERNSGRRLRYEKNPGRLNRGSDRKSRINDAFLDARDRLTEKLEQRDAESTPKQSQPFYKPPVTVGNEPGTTVITFPYIPGGTESDESKSMGIDVNAVFDEQPGTSASTSAHLKLSAVQVMKIDPVGRVAMDGRIRVGDSIVEINGRPVHQMSILRARAHIGDLATTQKDVTLTIGRSLESFLEQEGENGIDTKPIFSALQKANTHYIGITTTVELVKSSTGFGFTVTSRQNTTKDERFFFIGTVKPRGVALGHLKIGDRLLEINGVSTVNMQQNEIVNMLKERMVGEKVKFLVARVPKANANSSENKENEEEAEAEKSAEKSALMSPPISKSPTPPTKHELIIPLNDTGSAGLGVGLKARVSVKSNTTRHDCGIFIKNIMNGGAAFKDGRLQVDDRIVGIEEIDLYSMSNADATNALTKKLKALGPPSSHVKLIVMRDVDHLNPAPISRDSSRITVDASSPSPSSRISSNTTPGSLLPSPHFRATSSSGPDSIHSRQSSHSSTSHPIQRKPEEIQRDSIVSRLDDSEVQDVDPFDREGPGRKSLSEKRGIGAASDPQHIKLFQEIKHQRQNSAPPASTSREKRSKSQPRSVSQRNYRGSPMKSVDLVMTPPVSTIPKQPPSTLSPTDGGSSMLNRRSLSMESINRPVGSILRGTGAVPTSSSSKVQFNTANQHPFPPGSPLMRVKTAENRARDRATKESRRKSVGNVMRSWFGLGSKSRDASPEKPFTPPRKNDIEEVARRQMAETTRRRGSGSGVYIDYGEQHPLVPHHQQTSGYESYADSELYDRYAAHRYQHNSRGIENDEHIYRQQSGSSIAQPSSYVNYGLPASHSYQVDARIPPQQSGSVTSATMRRAYPSEYDDDYQRSVSPSSRAFRNGPNNQQRDYYHMFNSWFAYTGGGAVGAAPVIKSSYGSPVRIAAASAIERGESFIDSTAHSAHTTGAERRVRSTSSGGAGHGHAPTEKYADARGGRQQYSSGGSTRLFIPRHGGGISSAMFANSQPPPAQNDDRFGAGSPSQFRRRNDVPSNRFPQY